MKRRLAILSIFCAGALAQEPATPRAGALELAGAFANDGFKCRDGFVAADVSQKKPLLLEVNLFAGNTYWFLAAANGPLKKFAIEIFDEKGEPLGCEPYADGRRAGAGFCPPQSGSYFVKVRTDEKEAAPVCLLYCYK